MADLPDQITDTETDDESSDEDVLAEALERFEAASGAWSINIDLARNDIRFANGNSDNGWQWPDTIRQQRFRDRRPCLTINQLPQFVKQITNDMRQNRPTIKYRAVDSRGDPLLAKVAQGIARHVMSRSHASQAIDLAADNQVTCGFGYWRIITEYADNEGFNQEIRILPVWDPLSVMLDPLYQMPDGSDCEYGFVTERISKKEYARRYPGAKELPWDRGVSSNVASWISDDSILVADYYYKQHTKKTIYQLADGTVSDVPPIPEMVIKSREVDVINVKWCVLNGQEIIEKRDWPGSIIPIIPVFGRSFMVDGIRYYSGIIRNAKDPQRNYNFWNTSATELIALAPKAPYIAAEGQFEGHEAKWNNANVVSYPYLEYKPTTIAGQPAPPPQRQPFAGVPAGVIDQLERSRQDMKTTTGIYQAALGQNGNEVSGRAITARMRESDNSVFDFPDNQARAIALTGRAILELIPAVYDTQRIVRMVNDDDTEIAAEINGPNLPMTIMQAAAYDVICDVGPSYATKRAEAAESLMTFVKQIPAAGQVSADLIAKNMDWPGADQLAERLKLMLPPPIQHALAEKNPQMAALTQQLQQQDQEAKQAVSHVQQQAQQKITELAQEIEDLQRQMQDKSREFEIKEKELELKRMIEANKIEEKKMEMLFKVSQTQENEGGETDDDGEAQRQLEWRKAELDASTKIAVAQISAKAAVDKTLLAAEQAANAEVSEELTDDGQDAEMSVQRTVRRAAPIDRLAEMHAEQMAKQNQLSETIQTLAQMIAKPRKLIRDENGRAAGSVLG